MTQDELINVALHEADRRNLKRDEADRARRGLKYDPFDDEMANKLLPQYDERDTSKHRRAFTLDEGGRAVDDGADSKGSGALSVVERALKRTEYDLSDLAKSTQVRSDYVVEFKRKKKRKKKRKRTDGHDQRFVVFDRGTNLEDVCS